MLLRAPPQQAQAQPPVDDPFEESSGRIWCKLANGRSWVVNFPNVVVCSAVVCSAVPNVVSVAGAAAASGSAEPPPAAISR